MYEALENWKQYKQEKDLQTKIAKEFKLFKDLTTMSSPDYLLRDNDGKLLFLFNIYCEYIINPTNIVIAISFIILYF